MLKKIRDSILNLITTRLFLLFVFFILAGGVLIFRVFDLQIVHGAEYMDQFILKIRKEKTIPGTRGNIYDRSGNLLAYNDLSYDISIEDVFESGSSKNAKINDILLNTITMIESTGDRVVNDFNIIVNDNAEYEFAVSGTRLLRFLADVYGHAKTGDVEYSQQTATPDEVMTYLADKFAIGQRTDPEDRKSFVPGLGYTKEELLKIVTIRYAMNNYSFQKYLPTTIASQVSEETVAIIKENSEVLEGVDVEENTIRNYVNGTYFSHILGYTGKISQDELAQYSAQSDDYILTDMVGKAGIEQAMELALQGTKGSEVVFVDNMGKTIETIDRTEPVAGDDVTLTIDSDLQIAAYHILEQYLAGIVVSKIRNIREYTPSENANASQIVIPIYDVYYALINNNVIDIGHFAKEEASETEKMAYQKFLSKKDRVFAALKDELESRRTPYDKLTTEYQVYQSYIIAMLKRNSVLNETLIDSNDATYQAWTTEETISMTEFLEYCIAMNWVDVTKLDLNQKYSDSQEIMNQLEQYIFESLDTNSDFYKRMYRYMIRDEEITGYQVCTILLDQDVINITEDEKDLFLRGGVSAYTFMVDLIKNLDITPAQLALDPCSASFVMTDVNTGEVLALVSYPSYDNSRLANTIDADYYAELNSDQSRPLWNYATQERTAPGSTFKMVSATAGLMEGMMNLDSEVVCQGVFSKLTTPFRCWKAGGHGMMNVTEAITNSCNVYFYEMAYRLSQEGDAYNGEQGVDRLSRYAELFGLNEKSGIEIEEAEPAVSSETPVPSAIGQGNANYTTAGLARYVTAVANSGTCYNLSLIDKLTDHTGNLLEDYTPVVRNQIELPESYWNAIHGGMRGVVENKLYFNGIGVNVAGKTGTAEQTKSRPNHALFVGYAPFEAPEVAVSCRIANGYSSDFATRVSKDILSFYYGAKDESELVTGKAADLGSVSTTRQD